LRCVSKDGGVKGNQTNRVMPGLVPGIHAVVLVMIERKTAAIGFFCKRGRLIAWIPATSAGMTLLVGCGMTPPSFEMRLSGAPQDEGSWANQKLNSGPAPGMSKVRGSVSVPYWLRWL